MILSSMPMTEQDAILLSPATPWHGRPDLGVRPQNRLRLLQIVDGFRLGGAENKLCELIANLDRQKFEILLANVGPSGPLAEKFNRLGIEIFHFPRRFGFDPLPLWQLFRLMRQRRIDVVQTTLLWADLVGCIAAGLAGVPAILSWETVSHEGDPFHNNFQRRFGYRLAMKFADVIVPVSEEIKRSLMRRRYISHRKIRVVYYGVDLKKFYPNGRDAALAKRQEFGAGPDDIVIGVFARLEPPKGHRFLLEALPEVVKRYPQVRVILVGDGALRPTLEAKIRELRLAEHVALLGMRKDMNDLLNAVDLFVLPSISEGLPNVILEAMACQKPVIATAVGGIPEVVQHRENGYLVSPGDAHALQEILLQSLHERHNWDHLARQARRTVETEFSLERQVASFEAIYRQTYAAKVRS
ncbi:MAG: glycosyltransferase [candidate division KSB1 bacterium]|nr:glycosyltransferase [candidate division KSB1 bacterium]